MTLAPSRLLEHGRFQVPPQDKWVEYDLGTRCCVPGCNNPAQAGAHHIEPRSRTGGPVDYVTIDGLVRSNKCKLCSSHHRQVTGDTGGYRARIVWHERQWWWCERLVPREAVAPERLVAGKTKGEYYRRMRPLTGSWNDCGE